MGTYAIFGEGFRAIWLWKISQAIIYFFVFVPHAYAGIQQSHDDILKAVKAFVRAQTHELPGKVVFSADSIDPRIVRPYCQKLEVYVPPGSQLFGNSMIGVRCTDKNGWTLFVRVHITVTANMLIVNKPLAQGHTLQADDISSQNAEMAQMDIITEPSQAIGKVLINSVGMGQVLRKFMLRAPYTVVQGQTVQLQIKEASFSIRSEGMALNNAAEGQNVNVKAVSGQIVSGIARKDGVVDINP